MALCRFIGALWILAGAIGVHGQVIEFESNGLTYQTLTRGEVTIMYALLPTHIKDYAIMQVAISNGSPVSWTLKPEDFGFERVDGELLSGSPAKDVVVRLMQSGGRNDVIKLVQTYEISIYGLARYNSTNGYEQRRQAAFGSVTSTKLKAAAAASAGGFRAHQTGAGQVHRRGHFFRTFRQGIRTRAAGGQSRRRSVPIRSAG